MATICIADDRKSEETAIKLLLLSISEHCSDIEVVLTFPAATDSFKDFVADIPNVNLVTKTIENAFSFNVKPQALISLLEEGRDEVWWIDSDIILTSDFRRSVGCCSHETLIVCEEPLLESYREGGKRAQGWGFRVERSLPYHVNSGVIRVTSAHLPLLKQWANLLQSEVYRQSQKNLYCFRPIHMQTDQDVLASLLESSQFSHIPVYFFRRGKGIIQYLSPLGYSSKERIRNLFFGLPPFIHSMGIKPWTAPAEKKAQKQGLDLYFSSLLLEVSPYSYIASKYKNRINKELPWLEPYSSFGKLLKGLGMGNPSLAGLPLVILYSLLISVKIFVKRRILGKLVYER